jgi:spore germination protein YaaH
MGMKPASKQSLIWVWQNYSDALASVTSNASSFTHVSPALYQLNYDYASGPAKLVDENDDFDGLSSAQIADEIHSAGLKCVPLMYAGAGNSGTDQGIQNVLNDSPSGARKSFIDNMVNEALAKHYDGYNLDWEVANTGTAYGPKLVSFLGEFKSALNSHDMSLSLDLGDWYVKQCKESEGDGLVDLTQIGQSVDLAILEDYQKSFGGPATSCPATPPMQEACETDYITELTIMCNVPASIVSIGLIATDTNPFADQALNALPGYGFTNVAVWPGTKFLASTNIPGGATWYSLLADFLAK